MSTVWTVNQRNITALVSATALLALVYLVVPHPIAQYGAWLVVFVIWMSWFVFAGIEWLANADF